MRVFVTGATGEIGRRAVPLLLTGGHRVTAAARTLEKRKALERQGAETVALDLFDQAAARRAFEGHDAVVNLATHMPPSTGAMMLPGAWRENDRIRREGSATLAEAARAAGVERFVQESFAPIYDDGGDRWLDETAPVRAARYNRSVLDAEASAARFTEAGGAGVVLRFGGFYGDDPFTREMVGVVEKGWAPLPGSPDAYFPAVHLHDVASAVVAALDVPAGAYNVVDDDPPTRQAYFAALADAAGVKEPRPVPRFVGTLMGSLGETLSRSLRLSNKKLKAASAWTPRYPTVREGWPAVVAAVRQAA